MAGRGEERLMTKKRRERRTEPEKITVERRRGLKSRHKNEPLYLHGLGE